MKQKPIILNLTKQEAECCKHLVDAFRQDWNITKVDVRPAHPFIERLQSKLNDALKTKS